MIKWVLAAVGVVVASIAIASLHLGEIRPGRYDAQANERAWRIGRDYQAVSPVRLLADPERYDGQKVLVAGYVTLNFEDSGLHLDRTSYHAGLRRNAIWLNRPPWLSSADRRRLNRRYDRVAGTFDASATGHMGAYSGALKEIQSIEPNLTMPEAQNWVLRDRLGGILQYVLSGWFLTVVGWIALWMFWMLRRARRKS